jgi:acetyl-CoA acetyltransferase
MRSDLSLTVEACQRALDDAGLTTSDIDGLIAWPSEWPAAPGFCGPSVGRVKDALSLDLAWHSGVQDGPSQISAVMSGVLAVASGFCRNVLVYRTTTESTGQMGAGRSTSGPGDIAGVQGIQEWVRPFGAVSAANWLALLARRYMHETGATREQIGGLAVSSRRWASLNPDAVYRDLITLEDYLAGRMISSPLGLYDCDVPVDGSVAVIVSAAETDADLRAPVRIAAMGSALSVRPFWDQYQNALDVPQPDAARQLWSRTDLTPADVDVAQLYDGMSILCLVWLESLGLCDPGEAAAFVAGSERIGPGGQLPLNTGGGQMSGGRLHGFGLLHEACAQLQGRCGDRQVSDARVALVAAGGGPLAGAFLLTT